MNASLDRLPVRVGDTIDFVVDLRDGLNSDDFIWAPILRRVDATGGISAAPPRGEWDARKQFGGPSAAKETPLTPWEKLAHALLMSNEFLFVD